ncbi:hypothetical protein FORC13_p116 (plasmid) [Bacillus cereus]|uniref:hypothetical protein n=1 Tax=Bacillus cereus group TaxID=86661 RepID=UPI0007448580|nr:MULTISPECIES: hypothetical protein [Bacillus cereus group]ALZ64601.1 hypothetical protein FORC13_p116 [Bacillus cereus]MEC2395195.1 hypothetical protein [Bacillus toyonensis]OTX25592.1 hypothetical protein BK717_32230 [Bacillus thuringiensis serovar malayensis]OUB04476.1 hypothetical protein BK709_19625 [Bacillus thuringiensis serovar shandongiensis]
MNSRNQYKRQISFLFNLIHSAHRYSQRAYRTVDGNEVIDYQMPLAYTIEANTFATSALVFYHQNEILSHPKCDSFFEYFQNFNFEILQTIAKKDTNITVLKSIYEQLNDSFSDVEKLVNLTLAERSYQLID